MAKRPARATSGRYVSRLTSGTLAVIKETNYVFKPRTADTWLQMFGGQ